MLVAGGMGIAPLHFLAQKIKRATIMLGARTKDLLIIPPTLPEKHKILIATEDGSEEYKGTVIELMKAKLNKINPDIIYICGPSRSDDRKNTMENSAIEALRNIDVPAEISIERYMACGTGVCLSCVCETTKGYQRVCTEGPVFDSKQLISA